jgi:hypothetical protein
MSTADMLRAEGRAEGCAQGRAEGRIEHASEVLLRLLTRKFGPVPDAARGRVDGASLEQLDLWSERVLDAATMNEVFGPTTVEMLRSAGRAEGLVQGAARYLLRQLTRRFGPVPDIVQEQIDAASIEQLEIWAVRLLDARTLDEVFE